MQINLRFLLRVSNTAGENSKVCFHFWQTGGVVDLARTRVATGFLEL